jgi:hypothetical protein
MHADEETFTTTGYHIEGNFMPAGLQSKITQQIVHLT